MKRLRRPALTALGVVQVTLLIASQLDIHRRPAAEIRGPKWRWRLVCLINIFGPLSYFKWGRRTAPIDS